MVQETSNLAVLGTFKCVYNVYITVCLWTGVQRQSAKMAEGQEPFGVAAGVIHLQDGC